ncbi:MAG: DUF2911 domain-containing protein [Ferruginibacter sp.]
MKYLFSVSLMSFLLFATLHADAQKDKSKRPSPPATVTQKLGETTVTIDYSQPSVKGRTIGIDLEPMQDKVWRAGANEATFFEVDKDVTVEGKTLPQGKYGFFILVHEKTWTLIFNKTWDQWGAFTYKEADDVLRVQVPEKEANTVSEMLSYKINTNGLVIILWGTKGVSFTVKEKH